MDKFQAAFEILTIIGLLDGLDNREIDEINKYVRDNMGKGNYESRRVAATLMQMTPNGRIEELAHAAKVIQETCGAQDKVTLLDFALRVVIADHHATDAESAALAALGSVWNIDMRAFLNARM